MKKLVVLSMLSMLLFNVNADACEYKSQPMLSPGDGPVIILRISFHRPKFDCLKGFGVCLMVSFEWEETMGSGAESGCRVKGHINERNQLVIEVNEEDLAAYEKGSTLPYFRDKTSISILDPYPVPDETCRALGVRSPITIKAGNYPVSYVNGVYTVVFQL